MSEKGVEADMLSVSINVRKVPIPDIGGLHSAAVHSTSVVKARWISSVRKPVAVGRRTPGRIKLGFDLLGYHFCPAGLTVARKTIANFTDKASRLYEQ